MAMRDTPPVRDPLAGAELRQAARFAMTLVTEQGRVSQRLIPLVELGFPELGELFDDPTCRTAREVLRIAPTARSATRRHTSTLANANAGPGHRRLGQMKAERLQAAAAETIAVPELDAEVAFEVGLLLDQYDVVERQIADADAPVASLLDGELARGLQTIPGVGPSTAATLLAEIGDIARFTDFDQLLGYARVRPAERSSGRKGASPETAWHMSKAGNMAVVRIAYNPVIAAPLRPEAIGGQIKDERARPLHAQGAQHCLGRLAQRGRLRPQLGCRGLTRPYGI
jgi:transposase